MRLSIIIVNYNTKDFLDKCIKSIYENTFARKEYEIIVVDNCSRDKSVEILSKKYPKAIWLRLKENVGFAKANNIGIRKSAETDYIFFLNPDTLLGKNALEKIIAFFEKDNKVGIVSPFIRLSNGEIDDACHRGFPTPWNSFCHFSGLGKIFPHSYIFNGYHLGYQNLDTIHEVDACSGAAMIVRRRVGEKIGWWDEDYFWYGEDLDFCFRAKQRGWKIVFFPDIKILHFKGVSGGIIEKSKDISTADQFTKKIAQKARFEAMRIFYRKHYMKSYPRFVTWVVLGGIDLFEIIKRV